MHVDVPGVPGSRVAPKYFVVFHAAILFFPAMLLFIASVRATGRIQTVLWLGTAVQILICCMLYLTQRASRPPIGPAVILLYLLGLAWIWAGHGNSVDWYSYFAQAMLLLGTLGIFALQSLMESGALGFRRSKLLAQRLAERKDWPTDLTACRTLPEVKALREAVHFDAAPALALLRHPRMQVRVAALAALEFRTSWGPGQAELVLFVAQHAPEPALRAAAVMALGNVEDRGIVEHLAEFLRDPALEVRRAVTEALLWESATRWPWIRHTVHQALADPKLQDDGGLRHDGQLYSPEAVADFTAWTTEMGSLGGRAARTLGFHYQRALSEKVDDDLIADLKRQLGDPHTAASLRMELAQVLQTHRLMDRPLLEKLLDSGNPAPLRLLAAEALLTTDYNAFALATLRDVARLPNREIALLTADIVQRRLGVDLGLALGQPLPPVHSRLAAEITRRIIVWAEQVEHPTPPPPIRTVLSAGKVETPQA